MNLSDYEFGLFRDLARRSVGLHLPEIKRTLVASRLARRLRHYGLEGYLDYFRIVEKDPDEFRVMVDLLTTHTTRFFREPAHFSFLSDSVLQKMEAGVKLRCWCAACSTGEEAYSLAMLLDDRLGPERWSLLATDVSEPAVEQAGRGLFRMELAGDIPEYYLRRYGLKGVGTMQGWFSFEEGLRKNIQFQNLNLKQEYHFKEKFDFIFIRNVMMYFDRPTRAGIVTRLCQVLQPGGYLFTGSAESLHGISRDFATVHPSVYIKSGRERAVAQVLPEVAIQ